MTIQTRRLLAILTLVPVLSTGCAHTLIVDSDPAGARVLLDAKPVGKTTPAELPIRSLDYGRHRITVELDGYEMRGAPEDIHVGLRKGLVANSVFFFWTPFLWIKAAQTGYRGITYPRERVIRPFLMKRVVPPRAEGPMAFDEGVRLVATEMFLQVAARRRSAMADGEARFVVDPVLDADTGEVFEVSSRIREVMADEARNKFKSFEVSDLDSRSIGGADYVVTGIVPLERYPGEDGKLRHLTMAIVDRKTGSIVAASNVWFADAKLPFVPTPMYRDSPMYLKDEYVEGLIATARTPVGGSANRDYFDSLEAGALLVEASRAYDAGDMTLALGLFEKAAARGDRPIMKTYSGLYQSFFKLRRTDDAGRAFAALAELGIKRGNLGVKFLFNVNATEFFGDQEEIDEYQIWLREIGRNIVASGACVHIVGHASRSGTAERNQELSEARAKLIYDRIRNQAPGVETKAEPMGRGWAENIIGTGTNDAADAIDRRVEFKMYPCQA